MPELPPYSPPGLVLDQDVEQPIIISGQAGRIATELSAVRAAERLAIERAVFREAGLRAAGETAALRRAELESVMATQAAAENVVASNAELASTAARREALVEAAGGTTKAAADAQTARSASVVTNALTGQYGRVVQLLAVAAAGATIYLTVGGVSFFIDSSRASQIRGLLDREDLTPDERKALVEAYVKTIAKPPSFFQEIGTLALIIGGLAASGMLLYWFIFKRPEPVKRSS